MIPLTRLNGEAFHLNVNQIETLERCPDTRVTLANGKQLFVRESIEEVRKLMLSWYRLIHSPPQQAGR